FLDQFSATFSGVTLFFLGDIILTMCMRMYIISSDNTDMNYRIEALFHLIAGLNQIVLCYSIPAQALMDQADEVSHSVYFSKWYDYPHYAKHVWQIMVRDARRIEITAGGFVMIDLKMFMAATLMSLFDALNAKLHGSLLPFNLDEATKLRHVNIKVNRSMSLDVVD
uniref:Uncharacterized protein LOC114341069 n=1 Tax=Diabrotica virgifera virgifera TaxID=50390 RepID=A0A6P7GDS8_DIAVI